ncbi:helix-turn-helix domain-containing protein [Microbacterium aurum]|uniref:helix-turn-helix domain-containing protein n=1 Tax=Microbacterium aurum TaxID=36805 RepID=UPI0028ED2ADD|nr:helix-turn-helix domain-containing protein [Microbacterium aurum]
MRFPKQFVTGGALARARDLTGGDLRVLLALIVLADEAGDVVASHGQIAECTGLGVRSVRKVLDKLGACGFHRAEGGQGRVAKYHLNMALLGAKLRSPNIAPTGAKNFAPTQEKLLQTNIAPTGAKLTPNIAPTGAKSVEAPTRVLNSPTGTNHQNEPFARNALTTLRTDRRLPLSINELLHHAYRLGGGDPWAGYLEIKIRTEASFTGARNLTAVIRKRLEDAA